MKALGVMGLIILIFCAMSIVEIPTPEKNKVAENNTLEKPQTQDTVKTEKLFANDEKNENDGEQLISIEDFATSSPVETASL